MRPSVRGATRRVLQAMAIGGALTCAAAASAFAQFSPWATFPLQYADARVLPAGVLRVGFLPSYANYDSRFGPDQTVQPLGADLSSDTAGSNLLWSIGTTEQAVRRIIGDSTYRATLGPIHTRLDADVRRIPLDLAFGLTRWLTLTARLSLVKTRMQAVVTLDSTKGNVGWNQVTSQANNAAGAAQIIALVSQLTAALQTLESRITGGSYGCPSSPECAQASATLSRARNLLLSLQDLSSAGSAPPVAPLGTSPAGIAMQAEIAAVKAALQNPSLGLPAVTASYALPGKTITASDFQALLADSAFGYGLRPLATTDISRLGDTEVRLRAGLLQGPAARVVLHGGVRLPTATRDSLEHAVDLGTGDHQLDVDAGLDAAVETGALGLAAQAIFTRQFPDHLTLRSPRLGPLVPAAASGAFRRDLGDVLQLSAYPSLRLSQAFNVFVLAHYYRKSGDTYDFLGAPTGELPARTVTPATKALNLGGGIHYRAVRTGTGESKLPVEAGLSYQAAYRGSAGTPKSTILNLYLRLHYQIY